jgi:hypothetical protein
VQEVVERARLVKFAKMMVLKMSIQLTMIAGVAELQLSPQVVADPCAIARGAVAKVVRSEMGSYCWP